MKSILLILLVVYRWCISPLLHALMPTGCRFQPSCSSYATEAIELHGPRRGSWLALKRLLRCHPFGHSGFDPVPLPLSSNPPDSHSPARGPLPEPLP